MRRICSSAYGNGDCALGGFGNYVGGNQDVHPYPKKCYGTSGANVLKSTSKDNLMYGKEGKAGIDEIWDTRSRDKLLLTKYFKSGGKSLLSPSTKELNR
jgi:hypothetical protein